MSTVRLVVKYKKRVDTTYSSETVTLTTYTQSGSAVIAADTNYTYDVQLELTDDFSTVTISLQLSTAFTTMNFRAGGKGIGVGKVSEIDYLLDLASGWSVRLGSTTLSEADLQTLMTAITIPSGWTLEFGCASGEFRIDFVVGAERYRLAWSSTGISYQALVNGAWQTIWIK